LLENGTENTPVARQWLSSCHAKAATDTHAIIEELSDAVFSVRSVIPITTKVMTDKIVLSPVIKWKFKA
jgi:hypothetical protein